MKTKTHFPLWPSHFALALALLSTLQSPLSTFGQGTTFTYQGRLFDNGNPANGNYNLRSTLYDASSLGNVVGGPLTNAPVTVSNGLFAILLDFGSNAFTGPARWLQIDVSSNSVSPSYIPLTTRQQLTPAPYAIYSENSGAANSVTTPGAPAAGQVLSFNGSSLVWTNPPSGASSGWSLTGNSATGANFLGTTNNQYLEFRVNGGRAGLLYPFPGSPSVQWGAVNGVSLSGSGGNVIAGGGQVGLPNRILTDYSSIGGGYDNQIAASSPESVIAGGSGHRISGAWGAIGGGGYNAVSGGQGGTIPGGANNLVSGDYGFAAGNAAQATNSGAFVWADNSAGGAPFTSTSNNQFSARALGGVRFVTGGAGMTIDGPIVSTGGGGGGGSGWNLTGNTNTSPGTNFLGTIDDHPLELHVNNARAFRLEPDDASGFVSPNVIGGSPANTVGGGQIGSTIAGGGGLGNANSVNASYAAIGGGELNSIQNQAHYSAIGGGQYNTVQNGFYGGQYSFIGGGISNVAFGPGAFVGGGGYDGATFGGNTAGFPAATVVGGLGNSAIGYYATVVGGWHNNAAGSAVVGGGGGNTANGYGATVPGGIGNIADGGYSFAAGNGAQTIYNGSFVWSDFSGGTFPATAENQFSVRALGGVRFITGPAGVTINGVQVSTGGGGGGGSGWNLSGGNTNTDPSVNYLGTADGAGLELRVNRLRGLRLDYVDKVGEIEHRSINVIGGCWSNVISSGVVGATIAGGGDVFSYFGTGALPNTVTDDFGTVGGGSWNTAGYYATVPGGYNNSATGTGSFAAGQNAHTMFDGSFIWGDGTQTFTGSAAHRFDALAIGGMYFDTSFFNVSATGGVNFNAGTTNFNVVATGGVNLNAGNTNLAIVGKYITISGYGLEEAFIGNDGYGNDVQIGSLKPGITAVSFYNKTDNAYMHLYCSSITIQGGADLAEPFQISTADQEVAQGAVVVIDDENPGHLKMSDQPYDTRVAGVVSGANGISPGIQMQQQGLVEGGKNVALTGRVFVLADASSGAIKPGDLLTTSSIPGRAMKVSDHARAQGAILGKAMTGLKEGRGTVLVLVTLQ